MPQTDWRVVIGNLLGKLRTAGHIDKGVYTSFVEYCRRMDCWDHWGTLLSSCDKTEHQVSIIQDVAEKGNYVGATLNTLRFADKIDGATYVAFLEYCFNKKCLDDMGEMLRGADGNHDLQAR